jgi:hypothetical protein
MAPEQKQLISVETSGPAVRRAVAHLVTALGGRKADGTIDASGLHNYAWKALLELSPEAAERLEALLELSPEAAERLEKPCTCGLEPGGIIRGGQRLIRTHRRACPAWTEEHAAEVVAMWQNPPRSAYEDRIG